MFYFQVIFNRFKKEAAMSNHYSSITCAIIFASFSVNVSADEAEIRSSLNDQKNVAVTIYNNNLA
jgi:hypothetical protein